MSSTTMLSDLATTINHNISALTNELQKHNKPQPSFSINGFDKYPNDANIQTPRLALIEAAMDLFHLALGPGEYLKTQALLLNHDRTTIEVLNHFDVWSAVPLGSSASYEEISTRTKIPVELVRRYLRYAFTLRLFAEQDDGRVVHTAASAQAVRTPQLKSWIGHCMEDIGAACVHETAAITQGSTDDVSSAAFGRAFYPPPNTGNYTSMFDYFARFGEGSEKGAGWKERRFGEAMAYYTADMGGFEAEQIHKCHDWSSLGEATICDVGGSTGHLAIELASKNHQLKLVVQDLAGLETQFAASCPAQLRGRVSFQAYDFFTPQPVKGAHYLFKHILHDWPDSDNIRILRNTMAAMDVGSKIFIVDGVVPARDEVPLVSERYMGAVDLQMEVAMRAKERSAQQWRELLEAADPRLQVEGITQPDGCAYSLIEVIRTL